MMIPPFDFDLRTCFAVVRMRTCFAASAGYEGKPCLSRGYFQPDRGYIRRHKLVDIEDRNSYPSPVNKQVLAQKLHKYLIDFQPTSNMEQT
jgi:hypothetical protein